MMHVLRKVLFLGSGSNKDLILPKRRRPPEESSSHHSLCMLGTASKIVERVINQRIEEAIEPLLDNNRWGFQRELSTLDAVNAVVTTAKNAIAGTRWNGAAKNIA